MKATLSKCALSFFIFSALTSTAAAVHQPLKHQPQSARSLAKGIPTLPLITFYDSANAEVYNWWAENHTSDKLARAVKGLGDFLPPENYVDLSKENREIPENLRKTDLTIEERKQLAKFFGAGLILVGDVNISKSPIVSEGLRIKVRLAAQGERGVFTNVLRIFDLPARDLDSVKLQFANPLAVATQDLLAQIHQKKTATANVELVVSGKLSQQELNLLKRNLQYSIKDIASIKEKSYENEQIALAIEYKGSSINQLRASLEKAEWNDFRTQVVSHNSERIFFDVKSK